MATRSIVFVACVASLATSLAFAATVNIGTYSAAGVSIVSAELVRPIENISPRLVVHLRNDHAQDGQTVLLMINIDDAAGNGRGGGLTPIAIQAAHGQDQILSYPPRIAVQPDDHIQVSLVTMRDLQQRFAGNILLRRSTLVVPPPGTATCQDFIEFCHSLAQQSCDFGVQSFDAGCSPLHCNFACYYPPPPAH